MLANIKRSYSFLTLIVSFFLLTVIATVFGLWKQNRIVVDAPSYYTYLPAFFIHHDLHLNYIDSDPAYYKDKIWYYKIEGGKKLIKHPVGVSVALSPFFLAGHGIAKLVNAKQDGYSMPYQNTLTIGVWIYLFIGLFFLRKQLLEFFSEKIVALTLFLIVFATNLLWYSSFEALMPHAISFSLLCIANYYYFKWLNSGNKKVLLLFVLCFSLVVLIRPLALGILIYFIVSGIYSKGGFKLFLSFIKQHLKQLLVAFLLALVIGSLQFFYWKYATGKWIYDVYMDEHFLFDSPQIFLFLFSFRKGIFIYTPVLLFAVIGLIAFFKQNKMFFYSITLLMLFSIYMLSSWWAWSYGISWGIRPMIDYYSFLAFPLAAGLKVFEKKIYLKWISYVLIASFTLLNLFQTWQYKKGLIHYDDMSREAYVKGFFQTNSSTGWVDLLKPYNWKRRIEGKSQIEYSAELIQNLKNTQAVYFRGYNQKYFSASEQADHLFTCYFAEITPEETFYLEFQSDQTVAIKAANGKYLSLKKNEHDVLVADSPVISADEKFKLTILCDNDNKIQLQSMNGSYLTIGDKFPFIVRASAVQPGNNETFRLFLLEDYQGN